MEMPAFPQDPILVRLLIASQRVSDPAPMIHDVMGFSKGYPHLLGDILATRRRLLEQLPKTVLQENELLKNDFPYVFLFCHSGYEYLVGFFAIRAIGGAVMPLAHGILPEEAQYFQSHTSASCILFGKGCQEKVDEICKSIVGAQESTPFTRCLVSTDAEPQVAADVSIDRRKPLAPSGPGIVFLTSGTSGPPKCAVLPRQSLAVQYLAPPGGAGINCRPGHWIGAADGMLEPILTGQSLHCIGQWATVEEILQTFVKHRITHALFGPIVLARLRDLIVGPAGVLSNEAKMKYCTVFRGLTSIQSGGFTIEPAVRQFWFDLTGLPVENFYASTEAGIRVCSSLSGEDGCVGLPVEGVELKLSDESVGEVLLRSASMFTHYIGDEQATRAAFDEDGFLKTGDIAKFHNGQYYLLGRANLDYVYCDHLSFPTSEVERALLKVPGVSEACVVGVSVRARSQLCGAVIRTGTATQSDTTAVEAAAVPSTVSLRGIRDALRDSGQLPVHMFPVLLSVLEDEEAMPLTDSGKAAKGTVLNKFFGGKDVYSTRFLPDKVEVWHALPSVDEMGAIKGDGAVKAWDWGGLQSA